MFTKKHLAVMSILIVLVLSTMAIAYSAWADTLEVSGTASTGKMNVYFKNIVATPNHTTGYAKCEAVIVDQASDSEANDMDAVEINITDAYPGFVCTITGEIFNDGTVPARLTNVQQSGFDWTNILKSFTGAFDPTASFTIEPNAFEEGEIVITTLPGAEEGKSFTGKLVLTFTQDTP